MTTDLIKHECSCGAVRYSHGEVVVCANCSRKMIPAKSVDAILLEMRYHRMMRNCPYPHGMSSMAEIAMLEGVINAD